MASGLRDVPYGHQWTARTPIVFPLRNMLFWGMGLPLGLAAWIGWGAMLWKLVRKREWQHLLIWVWGTLFFLYQATLWVKSMRYLLPVYPVFTIFGAWVLMCGAQWAWTQRRATLPALLWRKIVRSLLLILPGVVLVGTLLWAMAFLQIYNRSLTRVEASRWMYNNIPAVATAHTESGINVQIPVQPHTVLSALAPTSLTVFTPETDNAVTHLTLNKVSAPEKIGNRRLRLAVTTTVATQVAATPTTTPAAATVTRMRPLPILILMRPPTTATGRVRLRVTAVRCIGLHDGYD